MKIILFIQLLIITLLTENLLSCRIKIFPKHNYNCKFYPRERKWTKWKKLKKWKTGTEGGSKYYGLGGNGGKGGTGGLGSGKDGKNGKVIIRHHHHY